MLDVKVAKLKNTGEIMEANNKLEEVNTEPVIQLIIPRGSGQEKVVSVTRKKAMTLAGIFAVVVVCLAGAAGFYGWQYHHSKIDRAAYQEYLDHKSEQDAKIQSLLDDNEKMLRDMSEIHTLETKLRRAVIQSSGDRDFSSSLDSIGTTPGTKSTDPSYNGKGGPGADISMMDVAAAQNKNLTSQIDRQKKNMHELRKDGTYQWRVRLASGSGHRCRYRHTGICCGYGDGRDGWLERRLRAVCENPTRQWL